MQSLIEYLHQAEVNHTAIGHFNVSTIDAIWAIVNSAQKLSLPVVIGVSEGERDFIGIQPLRAIIDSIKASTSHPIFLNADHTYSLERVKEVVAANYDSVIYDGAKLSQADNICQTQAVVEYVKSQQPSILVEAELGYIGSSSKLLDAIPDQALVDSASMPTPEDARNFVQSTHVDLLAPAVGNIHGMLKNMPNPQLNIDLIRQIRQSAGIPLVLHGGSGISDPDFKAAIQAGISMVHINTEIRLAWKQGLQSSLEDQGEEVAPYKLLALSQEKMTTVITNRLELFSQ